MKHLTHLLAGDLRHFRALIAAWVLVAGAAAALDGAAPLLLQQLDNRQWLFFSTRLLQLADGVLTLSLVAFVVQAHPLVGSDAFWMTRPIRWDRLLTSKMILLTAVLVGVPVICELVHLRVYDVPLAISARAVAQMALFRTLGLLAVMALASVTPNLGRFALVGGGALVVGAIGAAAANILFGRGREMYGVRVYPPGALGVAAGDRDGTAAIVAAMLLVLAALAFLVMQYRLRSVPRAATLGVSGALLALVGGSIWPWTLLAAPSGIESEATRSIRLSGRPESLGTEPLVYGGERTAWHLGWVELGVTGLPPGWLASATLLRASIDYEGRRITSPGHASSALLSVADRSDDGPLTVTAREVLQVPRLGLGPGSGTSGLASGRRVTPGRSVAFLWEADRVRQGEEVNGTYRGEFAIALTQMEIAATLPFIPGAVFRDRHAGFQIDDVLREESRLRVRARMFRVRTIFDRTPRPSYKFYIRNRSRAEASELDFYQRPALTGSAPVPRTSGFEVLVAEPIFRWRDAGLPQLDETWLADAELVIVRSTYRGSVLRTLEMNNVRVPRM